MGYIISPGCTGPNGETLALAAMDDGSIVVQDASEATIQCYWSLVYDITSGDFGLASASSVALGNPSVLSLRNAGGGTTPLTLVSYKDGLSAATTWNVATGGSALAVRSTSSSSVNLNVAGTGPYPPGSAVIAYDGWGNGQPNEIWTFQDAGYDDFPWDYTFAPMSAQGLLVSASLTDAGGQLTLQPPGGADDTASTEQLWSGTYRIDGVVPRGAVFVNEALSMVMRTTPGGGAVFTADPSAFDVWSSWRVGGAPDAGAWVVHSGGNDDLTLNVSGGGGAPGSVIITYPWQGGAENEQFVVTYVPHEVT